MKIRDIGSLSPEARDHLFLARDLLVSHIEKEDKLLYPALRKVIKQDLKSKAFLDNLEQEMIAVSSTVETFFDTYQKENTSLISANAIPALCSTVLDRIQKEEHLLFPLCSKYI